MDIPETIDSFKEYSEFKPLQVGQKVWNIDFSEFSSFNLEVSQELLINPEEIITCAQLSQEDSVSTTMSTQSHDIYDAVDIDNINYVLPDFCINNKIKVIFYLYVKKIATFQEISDRLGIEKSTLSKLFSRPDFKNGLVDIGLCQLTVMSTKSNSYKLTEEGIRYIKGIVEDYFNRQKTSNDRVAKNIEVRFYNLPKSSYLDITEVRRSTNINKLHSSEVCVRRIAQINPRTDVIKFECPSCGNTLNVLQSNQDIKEPSVCGCGRKGKFRLVSRELKDYRSMRVKSPTILDDEGIDCLMFDSLCDETISAGQNIKINYILKDLPKFNRNGSKSTDSLFILEIISIEKVEDKTITLNEEDINKIKAFSKTRTVYELADKFAPNVEGYSLPKVALLLQAVAKEERRERRTKINIAIVGDVGTGKTILAKASGELYNKFIFVNSASASKVGLVGASVRDELSKSYVLEAGAFPQAGFGLMAIDEIDKMQEEDSQIIAEPMEQNTFRVDKATIHGELYCPGSVLILGNFNPKVNDKSTITPELMKVSPHVYDRLDYIFRASKVKSSSLAKRLFNKITNAKEEHEFVRRYVSYAREHIISFQLSEAIQTKITEFYEGVEALSRINNFECSARLFATIERSLFASAKLRLASEVEEIDCSIVFGLIRKSLSDRGYISVQTEKIE